MVRLKDASKPVQQAMRAGRALDRTGECRHTADKKDGFSRSKGTTRTNTEHFAVASKWAAEQDDIKRFNALTPAQAERYLLEKSVDVSDKTLAGYAVALEHHLQHNCGYSEAPKLTRPPSEIPYIRASRAYTQDAVSFLRTHQTARAELSTRLVSEAGLRAHELLTLQRREERDPSDRRAWRDDRFTGGDREGWITYTVNGKGGLVREIQISPETASMLESVRHDEPKKVIDRGIAYASRYDVMGGKSYSNSFSKLSKAQLGHSHGAHGIRHTYAQERMKELGNAGKRYDDAKEIVSQELGHFRPSITDIYLR